jgi:hypothetical protein
VKPYNTTSLRTPIVTCQPSRPRSMLLRIIVLDGRWHTAPIWSPRETRGYGRPATKSSTHLSNRWMSPKIMPHGVWRCRRSCHTIQVAHITPPTRDTTPTGVAVNGGLPQIWVFPMKKYSFEPKLKSLKTQILGIKSNFQKYPLVKGNQRHKDLYQ